MYNRDKGLKPLLYVILRGLIAVIIPGNIALMTYICREWVGVSPAVIQSFSSMSAFTTAILFYMVYKEKLTRQHIIGMIMIIVSVFIVAICKGAVQNKESS
jgi:drug/metabolite transporter (DMT)-like permease